MGVKSASTRSLSQLGGTSKLSLVGQRCGVNGAYIHSGSLCMVQHQRILCPNGADAIKLVFPNFYMALTAGGEKKLTPSVYSATGVTYSGGSGYAVGDIDTFNTTSSTGLTNGQIKVMITAVSSGVPTLMQVIDGGLFTTPLASGTSPSSSSGSGTGATATFTWGAGGMGMHIGIEPVWNDQVFSGQDSVELASQGVCADQSLIWNLLVPMNDFMVSDLLRVDVPVGGAFGIRMQYTCSPSSVPVGRLPISAAYSNSAAPSANYETGSGNSTFFEVANTGTLSQNTLYNMMQPIAVLGIPKQVTPAVIALGDSRAAGNATGNGTISAGGTYDPQDADGNQSWFEKALSATVGIAVWPWSNLSVSGDRLSVALPSGSTTTGRMGRMKAIALAQPTAVYLGLNVNDIDAGSSLSTIQAYETQLIGELKGLGVKYVFTDTTDPYTSSTDNWASTQNQTPNTGSSVRIARNAALRLGGYAPYDFFIDNSLIVESSVGSDKWVTNGTANFPTGDGLHASPAIILLKAANAAAVMAANISL